MIDVDKKLSEYGLNEETYEACLKDIRNKMNGVEDLDWAEIVAKYNLDVHPDTLRKASQTIFGGAFVTEYFQEKEAKQNTGGDETKGYLLELRLEKEAIKRERQKLSDEKLEYNRWLREQARDELIMEKFCNAVMATPELPLPKILPLEQHKKSGILCFADTHYGTEFEIKGLCGETINKYSPEVFEERMECLLAQTIEKANKEGLSEIQVFSLGDEIDGILRVSQLKKLRYGVVEATIKYAEYLTRWLTELSRHIRVKYYSVEGNHSELRMLGQPKSTFKDDNMSKIIREFIKIRMSNNPNFAYAVNSNAWIFDKVQGYDILAIHGEVKNLESALKDFSLLYGVNIDILIGGHKHHQEMATIGINKDVVSVPSVIGLDDFSESLRKSSNAGAVFLTIEEGKGLVEQTMFKLN